MGRHFQAVSSACLLATASCSERTEQAKRAAIDLHAPHPPPGVTRSGPSSANSLELRLVLEGGALVLKAAEGTSRRIAFGSPASAAVAAVSKIYGRPLDEETLEECGAGPLQVSRFTGMTIAAQDGKFVGWSLDDRNEPVLPTAARIGIGSTRRALEQAYSIERFESSLGHEFAAYGLAGLLAGDGESAKITHLWAGSTCVMR